MPTIMTVRCNQCGHENNPEYRFCGMCGAPLLPPQAVPARAPERTRVSSVGGPSFLGLGDERSNDLDYLLDEEPPRGHGRLYLALLLLAISGGLLAWHWQRDGYPWAGLISGSASNHAPVSSLPAQAASTAPDTQPTGNATPPETQLPLQAATPPAVGETAQPPATEPPRDSSPSANPVAAVKPPEQISQSTTGSSPRDSTTRPPTTPSADSGAPEATESSPVKETPAPAPAREADAPIRKPAAAKPSPTISPASPDDRLVDEGEKYLYGRGVRSDCALAQRNLLIGARDANPKAQTLLGAMYATGHCVNRDLPTAYRWFAKALHGDPSNSRVQRDLEVLWKQMTPEERQLTMKSQ